VCVAGGWKSGWKCGKIKLIIAFSWKQSEVKKTQLKTLSQREAQREKCWL